jgi:predicted dehydrogenase
MIDVAVIGCGFMGRNHTHAVSNHPTLRLSSVVDRERELVDTVADEYGAANAFTDFERAVERADAVVVATPETVHASQARTVMDHDRHLLLEKPMTADTKEAWNLAERAADRDATCGVSFILRYDPGYAGLRSAVVDGELGEPVSVRAQRGITRSESERIGQRGHPLYYMNIHDIDAMRWCLDSEVSRVSAIERRGELSDLGVPDAMHATLTFENDAVGTLAGHGIFPNDTPGGISASLELIGTNGTASVDTPGTALTINGDSGYNRPDTRHWPVVNDRMDGAVRRQMDRFADAITGCDDLLASLTDGVYAQCVADAIRDAAEHGEPRSVTYRQ